LTQIQKGRIAARERKDLKEAASAAGATSSGSFSPIKNRKSEIQKSLALAFPPIPPYILSVPIGVGPDLSMPSRNSRWRKIN
jgi:hypothetical protein